jgi:hypothetical protein
MVLDAINQTIINYIQSTPTPPVNSFMVYMAIGGMVLMLVCGSYLAITKPFRKKSKTKTKQEEPKN